MLLNKAQAEAVYSAMCALNNVCASAHIDMRDGLNRNLKIREDSRDGVVTISLNVGGIVRERDVERYGSQRAFAAAYGLGS